MAIAARKIFFMLVFTGTLGTTRIVSCTNHTWFPSGKPDDTDMVDIDIDDNRDGGPCGNSDPWCHAHLRYWLVQRTTQIQSLQG